MRVRATLLCLLLLLSVGPLLPADVNAMDTKAAGRCVALAALSHDYAAKGEALLAAASATGHRALIEQRVHEEFSYLARIKHDQRAKEAWTFQAVQACSQF